MSKDRQQEELERTFVEHRGRLREVAQRIVGTRDLAEDVIQSAYLRIMDTPATMAIRQPMSYCLQIVRHLAIDYRRRMMFESRLFADETSGQSVPMARVSPEQTAISGQYLSIVEQALVQLPLRTRQAFKLYRLDGLTQREIARQLNVSPTLVNFMIRDAMDALQGCRQAFTRD